MRAVGHFEFLFNSCSLRFCLNQRREVDDANIFSSSKGFSTFALHHQQPSKAIAGCHLPGNGRAPCKASKCHQQRFLQTWCRARGHTQGSDLSLDDDSGARVIRWISQLPGAVVLVGCAQTTLQSVIVWASVAFPCRCVPSIELPEAG